MGVRFTVMLPTRCYHMRPLPMRYANLFFNGEEMPKQDIRTMLTKQINELTTKVTEARASLIYWESEVRAKEDELAKLQGALDSLDGKVPVAASEAPKLPARVFAAPQSAKPETVQISGEEVVLEPGFHVEKNSFGEDCIVPDGVKYAPAAEPPATPDTSKRFGAGVVALPAITSGDQFDSPEDIISGELPNG